MILIKLTGGLGNQLFQYAHGRALSHIKKESLYLDTSWYKGRIDRTYLLGNFHINAKVANLFQKLFKTPIAGDFQNEKCFKEIESILRQELVLKRIPDTVQDPDSVSIHLRGNDYVRGKKSAFHGTCSPEYYKQAIDLVHSRVSKPHFYIFTDDLPWAKEHIPFPEPFTIMSGGTVEELILMASCRHNIIANSTFSWWAAWLNKNPEKIVIGPKVWFADEKMGTSDILPASWIRI